MDYQRTNSSPIGRDIAGAWLVCLLIAVLALGLSSAIGGRIPPAAVMAAKPPSSKPPSSKPPSCGSDLRSGCSPLAEAAANLSTVANLHRL